MLNWHESTNAINNGVPRTFTIGILLLRRVKLFNSQLWCRANQYQLLELLTYFFPFFQVFTQTSSTGSLAGHLTRLAAECQRFLMSALLGLLFLGFTVNYIVFPLTLGNRPVCYPESAWWCDGVMSSSVLFRSEKIPLEAPRGDFISSSEGNETTTQGLWGVRFRWRGCLSRWFRAPAYC